MANLPSYHSVIATKSADQQANKDDVSPSAPLVQEVRDTDDGAGTSTLINTNPPVETRKELCPLGELWSDDKTSTI